MPSRDRRPMRRTKSWGLFENRRDGLLVPSKALAIPVPPPKRPLHVSSKGKVTEITKSITDETFAAAKAHYEQLKQKAIVGRVANGRLRSLVGRAAEDVMRSHANG